MKKYLTFKLIESIAKTMLHEAKKDNIQHCSFEVKLSVKLHHLTEMTSLRISLVSNSVGFDTYRDLCSIREYTDENPAVLSNWMTIAKDFITEYINANMHCDLVQKIESITENVPHEEIMSHTQSDMMSEVFKQINKGNFEF